MGAPILKNLNFFRFFRIGARQRHILSAGKTAEMGCEVSDLTSQDLEHLYSDEKGVPLEYGGDIFESTESKISVTTRTHLYWASGVIGKHASLRNWWRKPWEFKSPLAHRRSKLRK